MKELDAMGLQCPQPLMMAKKELEAGESELAISVSNDAAVNNLKHLGARMNKEVTVTEIEGGWKVVFTGEGEVPAIDDSEISCNMADEDKKSYAVFIGKDHVGEGDQQLGYNLMKMAIYTLSESGDAPDYLLFMNGGVKLVAGEEQQIIDSVSSLIAQGTEVLVCGTCLDYYGLKEDLKVGEVSNMYDILGRMQAADKVITL